MTIIGIDDTDSADKGMCTTYIGHQIATKLIEEHGATAKAYLVRLNPAAKHKTRGNAAVAIHSNCDLQTGKEVTHQLVQKYSYPDDPETNPGAVIIDVPPEGEPDRIRGIRNFTTRAMYELLEIDAVPRIINKYDIETIISEGNGRGRIGATAALAAHATFADFTYEAISYRQEDNYGDTRAVNADSVARAHYSHYPEIWDNYDPQTEQTVCVPATPCPVLYGIRGESRSTVIEASDMIESEPTVGRQVFVTNQGTDAHIKTINPDEVDNNTGYRLRAEVIEAPTTKQGGHVFFTVSTASDKTTNTEMLPQADHTLQVAAFEPTKRFREPVRKLREGDVISLWGEYADELLKLEKFVIHSLNTTKLENPTCETCNKSMSSMGADQGYRCSNCRSTTETKQEITIDRNLNEYQYEVPPVARRHLAKPLIRRGDPP